MRRFPALGFADVPPCRVVQACCLCWRSLYKRPNDWLAYLPLGLLLPASGVGEGCAKSRSVFEDQLRGVVLCAADVPRVVREARDLALQTPVERRAFALAAAGHLLASVGDFLERARDRDLVRLGQDAREALGVLLEIVLLGPRKI